MLGAWPSHRAWRTRAARALRRIRLIRHTKGDREGILLPEQPGWSLDDSEAHRSRERALAGSRRRSCAVAAQVGRVG
ncbi:hypothetical protein NDU88_002816 [Pleurodeles waltl]|uniref:Uncharacterized protein n=1 Tax=Pleurodeles waltl TaxID=8319 RepID=A0AAV7UBM1_PLEWA|nr:hypothetical protein NDU88_002816 [Pleurodeles waltl]